MADDSVMKALEKVLTTYGTGGAFQEERAEQLETAKKKYTTGAQAGLAGRGLAGTTIAASIPAAFEQEIGAGFKTETERLRSAAEMQALIAKAGFLESAEERALRERLADREAQAEKDRLAAEKGMSALQAAAQVHAARGGGGAGDRGTFGTAGGGWPERFSTSRTAGGTVGAGGATQHFGAGGGFTVGGGGGGGAATWGGVYEGGQRIDVPAAGEDQTSLSDLAAFGEQWMKEGEAQPAGGEIPSIFPIDTSQIKKDYKDPTTMSTWEKYMAGMLAPGEFVAG